MYLMTFPIKNSHLVMCNTTYCPILFSFFIQSDLAVHKKKTEELQTWLKRYLESHSTVINFFPLDYLFTMFMKIYVVIHWFMSTTLILVQDKFSEYQVNDREKYLTFYFICSQYFLYRSIC